MKNILLPTDFSENAWNAIDYAVNLFKDDECTFYLLNTYTPVLYDTEYILYSPTHISMEEIYKINSQKGLDKVEKRLLREYANPKHSIEKISAFNLLTDELQQQVKERKIELIIMGTQGATGADQILFGSNTVHAIKRVNCLLLAIPSNYTFKPVNNILFPTDFNIAFTNKQLALIKQIATVFESKIHMLHVFFGNELTAVQEHNKKDLVHQFKLQSHKFHSVAKKSVPQAIYNFQEENDVDMLAMINNRHSFFENILFRPVINEIGFHVKCPFLVIPSGEHKH